MLLTTLIRKQSAACMSRQVDMDLPAPIQRTPSMVAMAVLGDFDVVVAIYSPQNAVFWSSKNYFSVAAENGAKQIADLLSAISFFSFSK